MANAPNLETWTCEACTMGNSKENMVCFMCQTPRIALKDLDVKWEWHPNPDQWLAYDYESIVQIEEAYQKWKENEELEDEPEEEEVEPEERRNGDADETTDDASGFPTISDDGDPAPPPAPSRGFFGLFGGPRPAPAPVPPGLRAHVASRVHAEALESPLHQVQLTKGFFKRKRGYCIDFEQNVQISPQGNQRPVRRIASDSDDIFEPYEPEQVDITGRADDEPLEAPKCVICQFEYEDGDDLVKLRVCSGHGFHRACILNWINLNNKCPLCNTPIS